MTSAIPKKSQLINKNRTFTGRNRKSFLFIFIQNGNSEVVKLLALKPYLPSPLILIGENSNIIFLKTKLFDSHCFKVLHCPVDSRI